MNWIKWQRKKLTSKQILICVQKNWIELRSSLVDWEERRRVGQKRLNLWEKGVYCTVYYLVIFDAFSCYPIRFVKFCNEWFASPPRWFIFEEGIRYRILNLFYLQKCTKRREHDKPFFVWHPYEYENIFINSLSRTVISLCMLFSLRH